MLTTHHGRVTRGRHCDFAPAACVVQETPSEPVSPCVCQCGVSESTCQFYSNLCPCFKWPAYCLSCGCPREIDECSVFLFFPIPLPEGESKGDDEERTKSSSPLPHPHTHCPQFSSVHRPHTVANLLTDVLWRWTKWQTAVMGFHVLPQNG